MADATNGSDLGLFTGDQIATPEAPFSDVAVLADTGPDLLDRRIDDDRHRQSRILEIGIEQRRRYWRTNTPGRFRWKLASLGKHLHILQPS